MAIKNKTSVNPFTTKTGEKIYQLVGRLEKNGDSKGHSLAIVEITPNRSSESHRHGISEESFYFLRGCGEMHLNDQILNVQEGDLIFVKPGDRHQIYNRGDVLLEYLVVTAPAWEPADSFE